MRPFQTSAALPAQLMARKFVPEFDPPPGSKGAPVESKGASASPVVAPGLLDDIATWLSQSFDLPPSASLPRIVIASPERFVTVRYRRLIEGQRPETVPEMKDEPLSQQFDDVVAFYETANRTIFLREGWSENTPKDVSVLVHEMVHHLRNLSGFTYACPGEREKLAYAAQQEWLALSGRNYFDEFETDRMTLFVRTTCGF